MNTKIRIKMAITALIFAFSTTASAGIVNVWGERFSLGVIDSFYDGLAGHSSSIITGDLDTNDLSSTDLLWAVQPANAYTNAELNSMATYLSNGGRIAFMGEHGSFAPNENNRINTALAFLGSSMSIQNTVEDGGRRLATRAGGQILNHSLTTGVNTYDYAAYAPLINVAGTAQQLMLGSNLSSVMMAFDNLGAGSIFLITDQNVWDNVNNTANNDNAIMFENLLVARTRPPIPSVPEPESIALLGLGLLSLRFLRRKA